MTNHATPSPGATPSPAETLRRAAALMRERAYGATSGPWSVSLSSTGESRNLVYSEEIATRYPTANPTVAVVVSPQHGDTDDPEWGQTEDVEHIAAFSPEVADLLAVWLDSHADVHGSYECEEGDPCPGVEFARAYLGDA